MTITGSGNTWSKKNKYSICPFCGKKGWYRSGGFIGEDLFVFDKCKYCGKSKEVTNEFNS